MINDPNQMPNQTNQDVIDKLDGLDKSVKIIVETIIKDPSRSPRSGIEVDHISEKLSTLKDSIDQQTKALTGYLNDAPVSVTPTKEINEMVKQIGSTANTKSKAIDAEVADTIKAMQSKALKLSETAEALSKFDENFKKFVDRIGTGFQVAAENDRKLALKQLEIENGTGTQPERKSENISSLIVPRPALTERPNESEQSAPTPVIDLHERPTGTEQEKSEIRAAQNTEVQTRRAAAESAWRTRVLDMLVLISGGMKKSGLGDKKPEDDKNKVTDFSTLLKNSFGELLGGSLEKMLPKLVAGLFNPATLARLGLIGLGGAIAIKVAQRYVEAGQAKGEAEEKQQTVSSKATAQVSKGTNLSRGDVSNINSAQAKVQESGNYAGLTEDEVLSIMKRNAGLKFNEVADKFRKQNSWFGVQAADNMYLDNAQVSLTNDLKAAKKPDEINPILMKHTTALMAQVTKQNTADNIGKKINEVKFEKLAVVNPKEGKLPGSDEQNKAMFDKAKEDRELDLAASAHKRTGWLGRSEGDVSGNRVNELIAQGKILDKGRYDQSGGYKLIIPSRQIKDFDDGITKKGK